MQINTILFPSSYMSDRRVDEDLENEYEAAMATGLWNVLLFHYDKWLSEGKVVLSDNPTEKIMAVHRGWMMKVEQYEGFYAALMEKGVELVTKPKEYAYFHYFPNVYKEIEADTPRMISVPFGEPYDLGEIKKTFDRFMVKDYVKSVKGTDFPKFFTKDITEDEFQKNMEIFYKYRGDLASGGLCFKEYVDLKTYDGKTNEFRVFYINHEAATVSRNSLQPDYTLQPPEELIRRYKDLPSPFYTIDYAELSDGSFKILEAGDGSVSGSSEGQNLEAFYRALHHCMN